MTKRAVIFDLDQTLADISHRLHYVTNGDKRWDAFFDACDEDDIIEGIVELYRLFASQMDGPNDEYVYEMLIVSGRSERVREKTQAWLAGYDLNYDRLFMRPEGDFRPDHIVKEEFLNQILAEGYSIDFVIDDRPSVVAMWRRRGLTCLQCAPDPVPPIHKATLTLMVGPSGAGKSTWLQPVHPSIVVSSDQLRQELCGDFRDQSKNEQVFKALRDIVTTRLSHGLNTIIDATNIKRKDRLEMVALANGGPVQYVVIDRPMEEKRQTAGWRAELPFDLLEKHQVTFNSQLKDILKGDNLPNVTVSDERVI